MFGKSKKRLEIDMIEHTNVTISALESSIQNTLTSLAEDMDERARSMERTILDMDAINKLLTAQITRLEESFGTIRNKIPENRLDTSEPYLNFSQSDVDEDGKLRTVVMWNDAFMDRIKQQGFTGKDDDEVVAAYLAKNLSLQADAHDEA